MMQKIVGDLTITLTYHFSNKQDVYKKLNSGLCPIYLAQNALAVNIFNIHSFRVDRFSAIISKTISGSIPL